MICFFRVFAGLSTAFIKKIAFVWQMFFYGSDDRKTDRNIRAHSPMAGPAIAGLGDFVCLSHIGDDISRFQPHTTAISVYGRFCLCAGCGTVLSVCDAG